MFDRGIEVFVVKFLRIEGTGMKILLGFMLFILFKTV